jgi:hypothetical protein
MSSVTANTTENQIDFTGSVEKSLSGFLSGTGGVF